MKMSIVIVVLNEEKSIKILLDSLLSQSKKADEIIFIDGGSHDATRNIINTYIKRESSIKLLAHKGTIAQNRNFGIENATYDIIVHIDAGCRAHKEWFKKMTLPFKNPKVEFVGGFFRIEGKTSLQKASAIFLGSHPHNTNLKTYLPPAVSMAFRKSLWRRLGGFSEFLTCAAEDTLFTYQAVKHHVAIIKVRDAIVYWEAPDNLFLFFKKISGYAQGDVETKIWWHPLKKFRTHNIKALTIFGRYMIGIIIIILSFYFKFFIYVAIGSMIAYFYFPLWKVRKRNMNKKAQLWLPFLQVLSDCAVMTGFIKGLIKFNRTL